MESILGSSFNMSMQQRNEWKRCALQRAHKRQFTFVMGSTLTERTSRCPMNDSAFAWAWCTSKGLWLERALGPLDVTGAKGVALSGLRLCCVQKGE